MRLGIIISVVFTFYFQMQVRAQLKTPPLSPPATLIQEIGFTKITVNYERPSARGRSQDEVFGKLVPFGKVWRTGAGPGTTVHFSTDVFIDGRKITAGIYSLYTIPDKDQWNIILNTDTAAYGAFHHNPEKDVVNFKVPATTSARFYEALTIDIDFIPNNGRMYISWLKTQVSFDIQTGLDDQIMEVIKAELLTGKSNNTESYDAAIQYYAWHQKNPDDELILIKKAISLKNERWWYYPWIRLLMKQKRYDEAIKVCNSAIELINNTPQEGYDKKELIADFENLKKECYENKLVKKM